ncbi:MAG: hypothetical protein MUE73_20675 [Planctomycetes bacterium]|jgi:hypothetical protein|nr:hypothetical protein [Planctomycetota bacterium]
MDLRYPCPQCGRAGRADLVEEAAVLSCPHCDYIGLLPLDWQRDLLVTRCPMCACPELFRDARLDPRVWIGFLLGGLALAPLTRFASLAAAAAAGLLLRLAVPERLVCYRCGASLRGHRRGTDRGRFDARERDRVRSAAPPRTARPPRTPRA